MKYMTMEKKRLPMNLQIFAGGGEEGGGADGDDSDADDADEDGEEGEAEKKYTEEDMERAVERRLNREHRKWERQQSQKPENPSGSGKEEPVEDLSEELRLEKEKSLSLERFRIYWAKIF